MLLSAFDFPFDASLVAERPVEPRDQARVLVVPLAGGAFLHRRMADLPELLQAGDLLVVNDTKVLPVRVVGRKRPSGARVDVVLVRPLGEGHWEVYLKGRTRLGLTIEFEDGVLGTVVERGEERTTLHLALPGPVTDWLDKVGYMPLPPYIKRKPVQEDRVWYQTMFASTPGAIAAPTAGLHFTDRLVGNLGHRGIRLASVTLQVGPATFKPVTAERIEEHRMGVEWGMVPDSTVQAMAAARGRGGRVIAVGTTVVRALESAVAEGMMRGWSGNTNLYIRPGYRFRAIDGLLTNFHLPRTTLLMLVSALTGVERLREAYQVAISERYRFYSYGDGMLII